DQWLRPLVVELEPLADRFRCVVRPALLLRTLQHPLGRDDVRELELEYGVEWAADLAEHLVERLRLWNRAREAVEDESFMRVRLREALPYELDHEVVRHELPSLIDRLHTPPEGGPGRHRVAKHVARRDLRNAVRLRNPLRLRPLSRALGTE